MFQTLVSFRALLVAVALLLTGNGLLATLLALRANAVGFSLETTGLVLAFYHLGFILGSLHAGRFITRVGHIRAFAAFAAIASSAALAHVLAIQPVAWMVLRFFTGAAMAGLFMVTESWLNEGANGKMRGRLISAYMMVNLAGVAAGQLLLASSDPLSFELFALAAILASLALVPVALTHALAPELPEPHPMNLAALYGNSPLGLIACIGSGIVMGAFWAMAPVFAAGLGYDTGGIARFMFATIAGGIVLQYPVGRLSDRIDRRFVIAGACFAAALAAAALGSFAEAGIWLALPLAALFGGLVYPLYSLAVAHTNDFVDQRHFVAAGSALLLFYGCGAAAGPILAGTVMGQTAPASLFYLIAAVLLAVAAFAIYRTSIRAAPPPEDRASLIILPRTTPVIVELDPRAESETDLGEDAAAGPAGR
jgi:MFS family permease